MAKVLFIVSGATYWVLKDGTRYATGYWAEEFAKPYKIISDAGHDGDTLELGSTDAHLEMVSAQLVSRQRALRGRRAARSKPA